MSAAAGFLAPPAGGGGGGGGGRPGRASRGSSGPHDARSVVLLHEWANAGGRRLECTGPRRRGLLPFGCGEEFVAEEVKGAKVLLNERQWLLDAHPVEERGHLRDGFVVEKQRFVTGVGIADGHDRSKGLLDRRRDCGGDADGLGRGLGSLEEVGDGSDERGKLGTGVTEAAVHRLPQRDKAREVSIETLLRGATGIGGRVSVICLPRSALEIEASLVVFGHVGDQLATDFAQEQRPLADGTAGPHDFVQREVQNLRVLLEKRHGLLRQRHPREEARQLLQCL